MPRRQSSLSVRLLGAGAIAILLTACSLEPATAQAPISVPGADASRATVDERGPAPGTPDDEHQASAEVAHKSLLELLRGGGLMMIPLLSCSFLMFVFVFEKIISLRRGRVIPGPFVKRFLAQVADGKLDRASALKLLEESKSPVADVFTAAVKKWGRPAVEIEQALIDAGERVAHRLRRYLRLFNGLATVGPLLGLLGTVFGMIRLFNAVATADAMGRTELLAGGISEALMSTATGLGVAAPALCFYLLFLSRVDQLLVEIDALGQEVVEAISAEALQEGKSARAASRRSAAA
jgi:biopolymer transport protein ExbB